VVSVLAPNIDMPLYMCMYPSASYLTLLALKVCERSLSTKQGGPSMPLVQPFIRGEMLPGGFLIRPSDGGGSVIHIVDHMDLEVTGSR
jgi:hypothetical protein